MDSAFLSVRFEDSMKLEISKNVLATRRTDMSLGTILLVLLILILIGALPTWPYSSGWGYYPSGGLGIVLIIVIILLLTGRL
jgi:membrane protein YdbS with pleckstrin-like domain